MRNPSDYAILLCPLSREDGGGYLAVVPDLPGCLSDGDTPERAFTNAQDAIASWIEAATDAGRPIPDPSPSHPELLIDSRRTPH
jgi:antitoxin HicB